MKCCRIKPGKEAKLGARWERAGSRFRTEPLWGCVRRHARPQTRSLTWIKQRQQGRCALSVAGGYKTQGSRIRHQPFCPHSESRHFRTCCPWLVSTKGKCLKNRSLGRSRSCRHTDMCTYTSSLHWRKVIINNNIVCPVDSERNLG